MSTQTHTNKRKARSSTSPEHELPGRKAHEIVEVHGTAAGALSRQAEELLLLDDETVVLKSVVAANAAAVNPVALQYFNNYHKSTRAEFLALSEGRDYYPPRDLPDFTLRQRHFHTRPLSRIGEIAPVRQVGRGTPARCG